MVRVDILSDPICPWCYIGKAEMARALARHATPPVVISWHPFRLDPDMPPEGMDRREYLEAKFGGPRRAAEIYAHIAERAEAAGLMLNLAAVERTPDTLDAHRLIHWAGLEGRQQAVVAALFGAYFERGRDISRHDVLLEIAEGAGMDRAATARLLASDADRAEIVAADGESRRRGVSGVPTFVVAGRHVVTGAQPAEFWARVFDEITAAEGTA